MVKKKKKRQPSNWLPLYSLPLCFHFAHVSGLSSSNSTVRTCVQLINYLLQAQHLTDIVTLCFTWSPSSSWHGWSSGLPWRHILWIFSLLLGQQPFSLCCRFLFLSLFLKWQCSSGISWREPSSTLAQCTVPRGFYLLPFQLSTCWWAPSLHLQVRALYWALVLPPVSVTRTT